MERDLRSYFNVPKSESRKNTIRDPPEEEKVSRTEVKKMPETSSLVDISYKQSQDFDEKDYELPSFLKKENIKDSQRRRPNDPDYDPSTLYIPPGEKFTPAMKQYWDIKKDHFDKILLFKLGKFYELFFLDAIAVQSILELKWMGNEQKKAHVGFPEKALEKNAAILIEKGLKVVVVEQTETTLKNRVAKSGKAVGREISEILTKSTFSSYYMSNDFEPSYLVSIVEIGDIIGVTVADLATCDFVVGECSLEEFRNLVSRIRPSEYVYNQYFISPQTLKMLKGLPIPPVLSPIKNSDEWNPIKIHEYYSELPEILSNLPPHSALRSLIGCCCYLKSTLLLDRIIPIAHYSIYSPESLSRKHMTLDSQALEHLEVLLANNGKEKSIKGSLYEFVNKCKTPFGKRMLKKWISAPLLNIDSIISRQEAVSEALENIDMIKVFDNACKSLPDLERVLSRLSTYSIKTTSKAVYFEDVSTAKIKELCGFLKHMKDIESLIDNMSVYNLQSRLLTKLLTTTEDNGYFPVAKPQCDQLLKMIFFNSKSEPEPIQGVCESYDNVRLKILEIENLLQQELLKERQRFNNNPEINYIDSKFRKELEVPMYLVQKNKPKEYEETSARNGFQRYYTKAIKSLADQLEIAEDNLKNELKPFITNIMGIFYKDYDIWKNVIDIISEVDCLFSLAKLVTLTPFTMTKPTFTSNPSQLKASNLVHPILATRVMSFVSNDIFFDMDNHCYVLTGPNMGGKSTVLRKVAIAVVLAQIGSFVPAEEMILSPVDCIYTRLGASDCLIEGKSTFFVEMEEAGKFFKSGTQNSLVIMDELGRGTSTQDGSALALAILKGLTSGLKPRILFTTHYHMILNDIEELPGVMMYHMDSIVDPSTKSITFLYKLKKGQSPKSYGLNVARLAGLPDHILQVALKKAEEIEKSQKLAIVTALLKKLKMGGIENPLPYLKTILIS